MSERKAALPDQGLRHIRGPAAWFVLTFIAAVLLSGCATPPDPSDKQAYAEFKELNDPLEPLNRRIFALNRGVDALFLKPFAEFYKHLVPPPFQRGVRNFLTNLKSPVVLVNNLLEGQFERAGDTTARFAINTTLGVGGLDDPARDLGFPSQTADFGITLASWGVDEGPFLMLPVLGPSNPRDAAGLAVDNLLIDPVAWWIRPKNDDRAWIGYTRQGVTAVDARANVLQELNELEKTSFDFYAAVRSLYRQHRASEINKALGRAETFPSMEEFPPIEDENPADAPPLPTTGQ